MKRITRDTLTAVIFICVIFCFFILNFNSLKAALLANFSNAKIYEYHDAATAVESSLKSSFSERANFIDLYGAVQLCLKKNVIGNFEFIKDSNGYMHLLEADKDVSTFNADIVRLNLLLKSMDIPLLYVQIPAREIEGITQLPNGFYSGSNATMDKLIANAKENGIDYLDVRDVLRQGNYSLDEVFYKTDVHIKTEAGFWIDKLIVEHLESICNLSFSNKNEIFDDGNYEIIDRAFLGNLAKSSGKFYAGLDDFRMYIPTFETNYAITNHLDFSQKFGTFESVVMNSMQNDPKSDYNTYWITNYLMWPTAFYSITNQNVQDNSLLVIMDSNGLSAISYLSLLAHNITIVDTRYIGKSDFVSAALNSQHYDAVIVLQGTSLTEGTIFPIALKDPQAEIVSTTTPTEIERGQKYDVDITVKNTGTEAWSEDYAIRLCIFQNGQDFGYRIMLPDGVEVQPGEEYTFVLVSFEAPPSDSTYLEYQMVEEGIKWFGEKQRVDITVK